jgi:hypothetical protein
MTGVPFVTDVITGIIIFGLGILVYVSGNKTRSAKLFSLLCVVTSIWITSISVVVAINDINTTSILTKLNHYIGTVIATVYLFFSYYYPSNKKASLRLVIFFCIFEIVMFCLIFFSDLIVGNTVKVEGDYIIWSYGNFWYIFHTYFVCCWTIGILNLYRKYKKTSDKLDKNKIRILLLGFSIGVIPPILTSLILPRVGVYNYYWMGPLSAIFWISLMSYSITRHRLFNIKIIAIELAIFALWVIVLIRIFTTHDTHSIFEECSLLIVSVMFGVLLIRGTLHEMKQNERIEELTKELRDAYMKLRE